MKHISTKTILNILLVVSIISCDNIELTNPTDPESDNYIGYESVDGDGDGIGSYNDTDEISLRSPLNGVAVTDLTLEANIINPEVVELYQFQVSTNSTSFDSGIILDEESDTNIYEVATLSTGGELFWRARAKAYDNSTWSDWAEPNSFTLNRFNIIFDFNGADSGTLPDNLNDNMLGAEVIIPGNPGDLEKGTFICIGWNTEADGTGTNYEFGERLTLGKEDTTLFVKWSDYTYMVPVDGGTFTQGSSFEHTISDFSIGKYEVTYKLWYKVYTWARTNGYTFQNSGKEDQSSNNGSVPTEGRYTPVIEVNWSDAIVWCNAYSQMNGLDPVYENTLGGIIYDSTNENLDECSSTVPNWIANGYRLPTEGEWEFAARGGHISGGFDYSGSDTSSDVAWTLTNSDMSIHDVGTKSANELKLYDMTGNAPEWCFDRYGAYPSNGVDYKGFTEISDDIRRIYRGGSYALEPRTSITRGTYLPYNAFDMGFRVARSVY